MTIQEQSTENVTKYAIISTIFILLMVFLVSLIEKYVRENSHPYIEENNIHSSYETTQLLDRDSSSSSDDLGDYFSNPSTPQFHEYSDSPRKNQMKKTTPVKSILKHKMIHQKNAITTHPDSKISNYVMSVNGPLSLEKPSSPISSTSIIMAPTITLTHQMAPKMTRQITPSTTPRLMPMKRVRSNTDVSIDILDHYEISLEDETKNEVIKHMNDISDMNDMEFLSLTDDDGKYDDISHDNGTYDDNTYQHDDFNNIILRLPLAIKHLEAQIEKQAEKSRQTELTYHNTNDKIEDIIQTDNEKKTK